MVSAERDGAVAAEPSLRPRLTVSPQTWWAAVMYIAAAALLLRMVELDVKPLHHDEGVNAYFLTSLVRPPHIYRYDPTNYHGPSLYYLAWASAAVFGLTDFALRFVPAAFGLTTIAWILLLRRNLGDVGALSAATLLTLSPGGVFHSRYFIHESILVCCTLGLVVAIQRYVAGRRMWWLLLASLCAAGMTTTKETWIIAAGVLICAAIGTAVWCRWRGLRDAASVGAPRQPSLWLLTAIIAVFIGVNLLFYTSLFTHWAGVLDSVRAFTVWSKTGQTAHNHPWFTYLSWLSRDDLPVLVLGLSGAALALWRGSDRFAVFVGFWTMGIITAYSLIPYKTPWLTLNLLLPLVLSAGWIVDDLAGRAPRGWRRLALVSASVVAMGMTYQTVMLNFVRFDDERYGYVYAQTNRELFALVDAIGTLIGRTTEHVPVIVMSPDQFPLSWYLRDVAAGYPGVVHDAEKGVVVASERQAADITRVLGDRFVRVGRYNLRSGVVLALYASRDLAAARPEP
jgi:uncharacterized protein (TIGR03663 family)